MREKVKLIFVRAWAFTGLFFSFPSASAAPLPLLTISLPCLLAYPPPFRLWKVSSAYLAGSWYPWYVNPANRWLYEMVRGGRGCLEDPGVFHGKKDKLCLATPLSSEEEIPRRSLLPAVYFGHGGRLIPFVRSNTSRASLSSTSACPSTLSSLRIVGIPAYLRDSVEHFARSRKLLARNINSPGGIGKVGESNYLRMWKHESLL